MEPDKDIDSGGRTDAFGLISRRQLLRLGLMGGAAVLVGGGGLLFLRGRAPRVDGLKTLTRHEYRTLATLARVHIPTGGPFPAGADDFDLARRFDVYLTAEPAENIRKLRMALQLVEFGPLRFDRKLATFSNLSPEECTRHWESWVVSDDLTRRQIALAFRKYFYLTFYDQETVWKHIGYGGPAFRRPTV